MQHTIQINTWQPELSSEMAKDIVNHLESGKVIYFPNLRFELETDEQPLLHLHSKALRKGVKNISYNIHDQQLRGLTDLQTADTLCKMMHRYQQFSSQLLDSIAPQYKISQHSGRTSFRPVEIKGRTPPSYRKDDTRLHVDAFPTTPTNNKRILRVFSNVNPFGEPRRWKVGEPYANVVEKFLPRTRRPWPLEAEILSWLKITRQKRSEYDHYMLQIHDTMKGDLDYQAQVASTSIEFPSGSTWIVYTDSVSHAALEGRLVLEQTFYPPVENMQNPASSPQHQLQEWLLKSARS